MHPQLFVDQLVTLASQVASLGQQGVSPQGWDAFLGLLCQKCRDRQLQAAVVDNRELQITIPGGNAVFTVSICGRLHLTPIGPSNVPTLRI
jgi:hypothetical protein